MSSTWRRQRECVFEGEEEVKLKGVSGFKTVVYYLSFSIIMGSTQLCKAESRWITILRAQRPPFRLTNPTLSPLWLNALFPYHHTPPHLSILSFGFPFRFFASLPLHFMCIPSLTIIYNVHFPFHFFSLASFLFNFKIPNY